MLDLVVHCHFSTALMLIFTLKIRKCSCTCGQVHRAPCGHHRIHHAVFPSSISFQFFFPKTDQHSVKKTQRKSQQLWQCGDSVSVKYSYQEFFSFGLCLCHSISPHLARRNLHLVNAESWMQFCMSVKASDKISTKMS